MRPGELVRLAKAKGLTAIAITDHDTVSGLAEAAKAAQDTGMTVVPGIELSTDATGREVHVLGYYCALGGGPLEDLLAEMRRGRQRRLEQIISNLCDAGVAITEKQVTDLADSDSWGRPHIARALVEGGYATDIQDAFSRYLIPGKPGYVRRPRLHPVLAVRAVVDAGGVAVLAHPGLMGDDGIIPDLVRAGLGGIEAFYPEHTADESDLYRRMAEELGLIVTGGSDFHGEGERAELGACTVPDEVVARLAGAAKKA